MLRSGRVGPSRLGDESLQDCISDVDMMHFAMCSGEPMTTVMCDSCGNIVDFDRHEMAVKMSLHKNVECVSCRCKRISREIDIFNALYSGDMETYESLVGTCSF